MTARQDWNTTTQCHETSQQWAQSPSDFQYLSSNARLPTVVRRWEVGSSTP